MRTNRTVYACLGIYLAVSTASADVLMLEASKDNTLYQDASGSRSNGIGQHIFAGSTDDPRLRRALLAFDVAAALPAGAAINSVELRLNCSRTIAGPEPIELHVLMAAWGEGTSDANGEEGRGAASTPGDATWLHGFFDMTPWASAGGDMGPTASASTTVDDVGFYTWTSAGMTADVQGWLDDPASDHGWMLLGNETAATTTKRFDSRENPTMGNRPTLTIDYTVGGVLPNVYESLAAIGIVDPANLVGSAASSPYDHLPAGGQLLFYKVDDGSGNPAVIKLVGGGSGLLIHF